MQDAKSIFEQFCVVENCTEDAEKCTGLVFKACESIYFNRASGKLERKQSFRVLKKKSCKCSRCESILDDFTDSTENVVFPDIFMSGGLYSVRVINESRDFDSGIIDDWDYELFLLSNTEKAKT